MQKRIVVGFAISLSLALQSVAAQTQVTPHPILFATAFPVQNDFATIGSVFGNHRAEPSRAGRGGDLWLRYQNGALRNITREAGLGVAASNQANSTSIAVRDVSVHWDATRAVFSLATGSPARWQLYEVIGPGLLTPGAALQVKRIATQPAQYNNVEPTYASDGDIIFTSDRPRNGAAHLHPTLDEYESTQTNTGLWKLDPETGDLFLMNHLPSGAFGPMVDSFGRVVFTRWDHMERDQQEGPDTFNWLDESNSATTVPSAGTDVFPEHKFDALPGQNDHSFNFFFPWEINQDGTAEELLNHLGRHEIANFFFRRLTTDPRLVDFTPGSRANPVSIDDDGGILHIAESPKQQGCFIATDADEFGRHSGGRLIRWCSPPDANPSDVVLSVVSATNGGSFRDPIVLDDTAGTIVASHTVATNLVTDRSEIADPTYRFRLKRLVADGSGTFVAEPTPLTDDVVMRRHARFGTFDYDGPFWELSPAEVRVRPVPPATGFALETPERNAFELAGVDQQEFRDWMRERNLGLVVVRDVTSRDRVDRQQPFNLRVPGGRETLERNAQGQIVPGTVYELESMQFVQADQVRGFINPSRGRRNIAQFMHDAEAMSRNSHSLPGVPGAVPIESDGSVAAFVPARRALAWQTLSPQKVPVVLERYWITLQPGEVRACDGCHGVNQLNQARQPASQQTAQALISLLQRWRSENFSDRVFHDGFE